VTRPKRRNPLRSLTETRGVFTATFVRYGLRPGWTRPTERTLLLRDITTTGGKIVAEHLWFNLTSTFAMLGDLTEGDRVEFQARAKPYTKGYVNFREGVDDRTTDYKLAWPTKARRVADADAKDAS
jgi:hypothetical protein